MEYMRLSVTPDRLLRPALHLDLLRMLRVMGCVWVLGMAFSGVVSSVRDTWRIECVWSISLAPINLL